ncbi:MAG: restriction endonuclease subunit S, partial [Rhodocyclaceae bacterium]|nr:restriction endonuclease subunit S [Rhodocyclaceae bacterium]
MSAASFKPLRDLCAFRHGGTPPKSNARFWAGDIPWVSPKDMKQAVIDCTTDYISAEAVENSATSIVPPGSILLVVRSGILAHSFPIAQVGRPVAFNQDIKAATPISDEVVPDYLYWFLRSESLNVVARGVKKGATVHSVQSGFIESLMVPLHSLEVQRSIVDLLTRAEGIVRLRREAQQTAAELIPAIFNDMFGDPETNPKNWPVVPMRELVNSFRYGTSQKSGSVGIPVLRIPNVVDGAIDITEVKLVSL